MRLDHLLSKEQAKTETSELHPKVDRMETSEDEKIRWKQSETAKSMTDMQVQTRKSANEAWVEQKTHSVKENC